MCWACQLARGDLRQKKTEWFFIDQWTGAVVEDLNPKGHTMRLLYVPLEHLPCGKETQTMRSQAKRFLYAVGNAICVNRSLETGVLDMDNHTFKQHWHAQLCLEEKK